MVNLTLVEICKKYNGNDCNSRHNLSQRDITNIGAGESDDLIVDPSAFSESVSINHCSIIKEGERFLVRDNNSSYGTFVNQARVDSEKGIYINNRDYLLVGEYPFYVEIFENGSEYENGRK